MDYELAKELQKAKFPKSKDWVEHSTLMKGNYFMVDGYGVPNLSELIEACGEEFEMLTKRDDNIDTETAKWMAYSREEDADSCDGKSPEEAVANLWLLLTL